MKNSIRKFNVRKFRLAAIKMAITACTIAMAMCSTVMVSFAANDENVAPETVGGANTMSTLISVVFWAVRIIVLIVGAVPGIIKINQGNADENPKERNAGIVSVVVAGVCFAATFAIEALI